MSKTEKENATEGGQPIVGRFYIQLDDDSINDALTYVKFETVAAATTFARNQHPASDFKILRLIDWSYIPNQRDGMAIVDVVHEFKLTRATFQMEPYVSKHRKQVNDAMNSMEELVQDVVKLQRGAEAKMFITEAREILKRLESLRNMI